MKTKSHSWFINELIKRNKNYKNGDFSIISKYNGNRNKIYTQDKFGVCYIKPANLLNGYTPSARSAVDPYNYRYNKIYDTNDYIKNGDLLLIDKNLSSSSPIRVKSKKGEYTVSYSSLFQNTKPSIQNINYRKNNIKNKVDNSKAVLSGELIILEYPINYENKVKVKDKYGEGFITINSLIKGCTLSLKNTLVDKNLYFRNKLKDIHRNSENLIFDKCEWNGSRGNTKVKCLKHGDFIKNCGSLLLEKGCPQCSLEIISNYKFENWNKKHIKNTGKLYILECFDKNEIFFKVGITCRSEISLRYNKCKSSRMPYDYNIIFLYESFDRRFIWDLELNIKNFGLSNNLTYKCLKPFSGSKTEVFINDPSIIDYTKNLLP